MNRISRLRIRVAARQMQKLLLQLDMASLQVSDYNKHYLSRHISQAAYILSIYTQILECACKNSGKSITSMTICDFGAGTGLLGIMAKRAGCRKVIYCDNYPVSRDDARHIASALGCKLDAYLCGDSNILVLEQKNALDALISMDVIEHIYNLDRFFEDCSQLGNKLVMVHVTGSNTRNPVSVRKLSAFQRQCEYQGVSSKPGGKASDLSPSYFSMRREIISGQHDLALSNEEVDTLARLTRGYNRTDIMKALYRYRMTGELPEPEPHKTNTCNPETGNWAERLTSEKRMADSAETHGFDQSWRPLYYNTFILYSIKGVILSSLNILIKLLGKKGLYISPLVMMIFRRR